MHHHHHYLFDVLNIGLGMILMIFRKMIEITFRNSLTLDSSKKLGHHQFSKSSDEVN